MDEIERKEHYKMMTETPVPRLIWRLAIPTIISMLVSSIYNTADTFFVSQLGTSAAGAVGVVFSVMAIIQAIGFTIGMGAYHNCKYRFCIRACSFPASLYFRYCIPEGADAASRSD